MIRKVYVACLYNEDGSYVGEERKHSRGEAEDLIVRHEEATGGDGHVDVMGTCECGDTVHLAGFTNTCPNCGADYDMSGMRLAPREQWGEETGETAADILMGGDPFGDDVF